MQDDVDVLLESFGSARLKLHDRFARPSPQQDARPRRRPGRTRAGPPADAVSPDAYALLAAVLNGQSANAVSVVQFLPLSRQGCMRPVAAAFAAASAATFGRTLLLDVSNSAEAGRRLDFGSAPAESEPLSLRRMMTPDIARPGLHYAAAAPRCRADMNDLTAKVVRSTAGQASPFRMIVLDEAVPLAREHALMLSMGCTATIAVAVAGESRLPEMRDTIRRLRTAGASLAGAVLVHPRGC